MSWRARIRRAFPYLVIAVAGFAVAYVLIYIFVLPTKLVPGKRAPYVRDTSDMLIPRDSAGIAQAPNPVVVAPPVYDPYAPPAAPIPVDVPDLTGMALPDARGVLNTLRLNTAVSYDTSSIEAPNTVLRQSPTVGTRVSEHGTVRLIVSRVPTAQDSAARSKPLPPIRPAGDTSPRDTTVRDTSVHDTSTRDTSTRDTSTRDTSTRDTSTRDTSTRDTSQHP